MLGAFMDRMNEPASSVAEPDVGTAPSSSEFEAFFRAEHQRLLRAMFVVTGSEQEAEELMQEAFLAVWERCLIPGRLSSAPPSAWCRRATRSSGSSGPEHGRP